MVLINPDSFNKSRDIDNEFNPNLTKASLCHMWRLHSEFY